MLLELSIENFALIDSAHINFFGGLNVLSGETGAGKSIILDAVQTVLGGRASAEFIRAGLDAAAVQAVFDVGYVAGHVEKLTAAGIDVAEDGLMVVRRELHRTGRGRITINGRTATAAMLRGACEGLCDLHGQHEHQSLLQPGKHLDLLDQYGGADLPPLRRQMAELHGALSEIAGELADWTTDGHERTRRLDLLRYQLDELTAAALRPGEEEELEGELRLLANAQGLALTADTGYSLLHEGRPGQPAAIDLIGQVSAAIKDQSRFDPGLETVLELLQAAEANVAEAAGFLSAYREKIDLDPRRLHQVEERLRFLAELRRKYGDSVGAMIAYRDRAAADIERLEQGEQIVADLIRRRSEVGGQAAAVAGALSRARKTAAALLAGRVGAELADLGISQGQLQVEVRSADTAPHSWQAIGSKGWDEIEFLFSPNPGEPPRPLSRIVSGGEMSRMMLALKTILARVDEVPTLIFDEIDTGMSGRTAHAVAEKLSAIARDRQVLCVTHLPQVAAMADQHFLITKEFEGKRTITAVRPLDAAGRADEIARMVGGAETTQLAVAHARELIAAAAQRKAANPAG